MFRKNNIINHFLILNIIQIAIVVINLWFITNKFFYFNFIYIFFIYLYFLYLLLIEPLWIGFKQFSIFSQKYFGYNTLIKNIVVTIFLFFSKKIIFLQFFTLLESVLWCDVFFEKKQKIRPFCQDKKEFFDNEILFNILAKYWFDIIIIFYFLIFYKIFNFKIAELIILILILIKRHYKSLYILIGISVFFYCLNNFGIDDNAYREYVSITFSTLTNFSILNIATFSIILQLNYQKFHSTYILWKIIKSPASLLAFFPSLVLIFSFVFIRAKNIELLKIYNNLTTYHILTFLQVFSILSLIGLLYCTKYFLEPNLILRNILKNIDIIDTNIYSNSYILYNIERKIDAILNLIKQIILNKDYNTAYVLFFNLACWIKLNIDTLKPKGHSYLQIAKNKFGEFFETIILILSKENDVLLQKYFIRAFDSIIFRNINHNNFDNFNILISKFYILMINNLKQKNNELAINIYHMLYRNVNKILLKLPTIEKCTYPILNEELNKFKDIYIEGLNGGINLYNLINTAIRNKNISFLKNFNIYDKLFDFTNKYKWDGKIFDVFLSIRHNVFKQYKFLIENDVTISLENYEIFMPYNHINGQKINFQCKKELFDYVLDELMYLYDFLINNEKIRYEDFAVIRKQLNYSIENNDEEYFKLFFRMYIFLIYKIYQKESNKMKNLFSWLFNDIEKYKNINIISIKEFIKDEINKLQKNCGLNEQELKKIINDINNSMLTLKTLTNISWFERLDLEKK